VVAAHAVGDDEQPDRHIAGFAWDGGEEREHAILVDRANPPDVA
jgi:hypothetical protein